MRITLVFSLTLLTVTQSWAISPYSRCLSREARGITQSIYVSPNHPAVGKRDLLGSDRVVYEHGVVVEMVPTPTGQNIRVDIHREIDGKTVSTSFIHNTGIRPGSVGRGIDWLKFRYPPRALDVGRLRKGKVLDLGCGNCALTHEFRAAGVDAYGVDIIHEGKNIGFPYLYEADAIRLPFEKQTFSTLFANYSLFMKGNRKWWNAYLREAHRVLKSGGELWLAGAPPDFLDELAKFSDEFEIVYRRPPDEYTKTYALGLRKK